MTDLLLITLQVPQLPDNNMTLLKNGRGILFIGTR